MINKLNKKKKKKGFTLIELVIVLAVLAIIALIAIPNFTKVRNDSLEKADARTGEQIEKITLMAIANQDITVPKDSEGSFTIGDKASIGSINNIEFGVGNKNKGSYEKMIQEVKKPQANGKNFYLVTIETNGSVVVTYENGVSITK